MTHARQTIREGFVATATGLATTGANVINGQRFPASEDQMPAWVIYPGDEGISLEEEVGAMGSPRIIFRTLQMVAVGMARATSENDPVEDTLDSMLEELETAVAAGIGVSDILSANLESVTPDYEIEADNVFGSVECTFEILYRTEANSPGTIV